jgi:aminoglycoside phosphotransferase (APT) family kinase protein
MSEDNSAMVAECRAMVASTLPEFSKTEFELLSGGWDSIALIGDGWVFKFPRSDKSRAKLRRESKLLDFLRPRVKMTLPNMILHDGPMLFSQHAIIPGTYIEEAHYDALDGRQRDAMAMRLAQFYAELHALPLPRLHAVGAVPVVPWRRAKDILERAKPMLPKKHLPLLERTMKAYSRTSICGDEMIFGYFDGHGWNMAFDRKTGTLNGLFDFADAGYGPRHRDLSYSNFISADLTLRIIDHYEKMAQRKIDRELVMLYATVLRFAELIDDHLENDVALEIIDDWAKTLSRLVKSGVLKRADAG